MKTHYLFDYCCVRTNEVRPLQGRTLFINTQTNKHVRLYSTKQGLDPWFITGFTDGEGCFRINILKDNKNRTGWLIQPLFQIDLHERDIELLQEIQRYFGGHGNILKKPLGQLTYRLGSFAHIVDVIIPHFDNYPLITDKQADYLLFRAAIMDIMREKKHLTLKGVKDIVAIKTSLNKGLSENLKAAFPYIVSYIRPDTINKKIPNSEWVAGFVSGEGCFYVGIKKNSAYKVGFQVILEFSISQHIRDELLLKSFEGYFGCGKLYLSKSWVTFKCHKYADNMFTIIPFFLKHKIIGVKLEDYKDWCLIADMIQNQDHLSPEGLERIRLIKIGMNKGRSNGLDN